MPMSAPIEGSATPFMETSRPSRNNAPHSTSSVPRARTLKPATGSDTLDSVTDKENPLLCGVESRQGPGPRVRGARSTGGLCGLQGAAVDDVVGAGDPGRLVGHQERHQVGDVLRCSGAAEGDAADRLD